MASIRIWLVGLALLLRFVLGEFRPYDYGFDIAKHISKRQTSRPPVVTGQTTEGVLLRQEIRELEQDPDVWTLYILGLSLMQYTEQSTPTSWYGLTGLWSSHWAYLETDCF
jgi:tyrosinase